MKLDHKRKVGALYKTEGHLTVWLVVLFAFSFGFAMFSFPPKASAAENATYYNKHASGWYWYQDPALKEKTVQTNNPNQAANESQKTVQHSPQLSSQMQSATDQMKAVHKVVEESLDRAILYPTQGNVNRYLALEHALIERSDAFSNRWKMALLEHPEFDYSLQTPSSEQASQIKRGIDKKADSQLLRSLSKTHGLFFFYRGNCPYCHAFAPILKRFAAEYGFTIIPISIGNGFLPDFPDSRLDKGQAIALKVSKVPALFLVNPKTHTLAPVSFGYSDEQALFDRLVFVANALKQQANAALSPISHSSELVEGGSDANT